MQDVYRAIEAAAVDLYGFSVVCCSGAVWIAEPELLEILILGLEKFWFTEGGNGQLSHLEFREEFYREIWGKLRGRQLKPQVGVDVPLGHEEMLFYRLPQFARAALYLRSKKRMSYASVALILGVSEVVVREEVEKGREFLLGRRLKNIEW